MDLRHLADFLELARSGNFSATARRRHVSQPALTRRIQHLERWAGERLLDRTAPVSLTPAGRRFLRVAERVVRALEGYRRAAGNKAAGPLRCMTIHAMVTEFLPRTGPHLAVAFDTYDGCFDALRTEKADAALLYRSRQRADRRFSPWPARCIGSEAFVPAVARNADETGLPVIELSRENYLGRSLAPAILRFRRARGSSKGSVVMRFDAVRNLVLAGGGVGWLPERMVRAERRRLRPLGTPDAAVAFDVMLLAADDARLARLAPR